MIATGRAGSLPRGFAMNAGTAEAGIAGEQPLTAGQLQYHLEEYKSLRAEIQANIKASFDAYLYALVSNGGIMAWLLTHRSDLMAFSVVVQRFAGVVPLMVTVLAAILTAFHLRNMARIAGYLTKLERRVGAAGLGWEGFHVQTHDRVLGMRLPPAMALFWPILVIGDIAFAALL